MKYLVELKHSSLPADYLLSELHNEFGSSPRSTNDPDIVYLNGVGGDIKVLVDKDHERVWITIEAESSADYDATSARIERLLDRTRNSGKIEWSQIEL
jgi:hypothetical protein